MKYLLKKKNKPGSPKGSPKEDLETPEELEEKPKDPGGDNDKTGGQKMTPC